MRIAVLFAEDEESAPHWMPDAWPYMVMELESESKEVPSAKWVIMSIADLEAHKARLQEIYDAAAAAAEGPSEWKDPDAIEE